MTNLTDRFHVVERQSVVRSKKWHTRRSRMSHGSSGQVLLSSVIYYLTDLRQNRIYSLYIIKKQNGVNVNGVAIYASVLQQNMKYNQNARVLQLIKYTGILNFFSENDKVSIPMKIFSMETGS